MTPQLLPVRENKFRSWEKSSFSQYLNISDNPIKAFSQDSFQDLVKLKVIDMRKTTVQIFPQDLFINIESLERVYADDYRLCCPGMTPSNLNPSHCFSQPDIVAECHSLIKFHSLKLFYYCCIITIFLGITIVFFYSEEC